MTIQKKMSLSKTGDTELSQPAGRQSGSGLSAQRRPAEESSTLSHETITLASSSLLGGHVSPLDVLVKGGLEEVELTLDLLAERRLSELLESELELSGLLLLRGICLVYVIWRFRLPLLRGRL